MNHTPTPWKVREELSRNEERWIDGADGLMLAAVSDKNKIDGLERDANAAFIVTACNAHEDLVNIAELFLTTLEENNLELPLTRQLIEKALAKAEVIP